MCFIFIHATLLLYNARSIIPSSILSHLRARVLACVTFALEVLKRFTGSSGEPLQCGGVTGWGYEVGSVRGGLLSPFCHNWKRQWALTSVGGFWAELLCVGAPLWNKGKPKWTGWPIFHLFLPALLPSLPPSPLLLAAPHALLIEIKISLRQFVFVSGVRLNVWDLNLLSSWPIFHCLYLS